LASFFFARFPKRLKAAGPFRIRKKLPQKNPTDVLTITLSHEFRNKIERPRAIKVRLFVSSRRSADEFRDTNIFPGMSALREGFGTQASKAGEAI
jgi:hypothetical protein